MRLLLDESLEAIQFGEIAVALLRTLTERQRDISGRRLENRLVRITQLIQPSHRHRRVGNCIARNLGAELALRRERYSPFVAPQIEVEQRYSFVDPFEQVAHPTLQAFRPY